MRRSSGFRGRPSASTCSDLYRIGSHDRPPHQPAVFHVLGERRSSITACVPFRGTPSPTRKQSGWIFKFAEVRTAHFKLRDPLFGPQGRQAVTACPLARTEQENMPRSRRPAPSLERQPAAHLEDALGACSRGDLSVGARREGCGGVGETHYVEDIGGLAAELEHNPTLELNVAE
jgi:hypothetical protein